VGIQELQERIALLNRDLVQIRANYAKVEGHLDEAHHWLHQMQKGDHCLEGEDDPKNSTHPDGEEPGV
jgi:hypothetical protein